MKTCQSWALAWSRGTLGGTPRTSPHRTDRRCGAGGAETRRRCIGNDDRRAGRRHEARVVPALRRPRRPAAGGQQEGRRVTTGQPVATGDATDRPPIERVRAIVGAFLAATEDEPELWRFVVHNPGGTYDGTDVVAHNIALVAGLITSALVDELRARDKDAGGAEAWAFGLAGMVYTAGDWWLQRRTMSRSALTDYLTNLIWGGLVGVLGPARDGENEGDDPGERLRLVSGLHPAMNTDTPSNTEPTAGCHY
jgi:hypothetical protein